MVHSVIKINLLVYTMHIAKKEIMHDFIDQYFFVISRKTIRRLMLNVIDR